MNLFAPEARYDRILSIEMFEHMMNWRELMVRLRAWLKPDGRFFLHIFTHRSGAYLFNRADGEDWIAQRFFTGGMMPSHHLIRQYADLFEVEKEWRWSGVHYQRTAQDWLDNFDSHRDEIERVLRKVHGGETALWMRRWRWFLLATAGLFGYAGGSEWGVSHYRLKAAGQAGLKLIRAGCVALLICCNLTQPNDSSRRFVLDPNANVAMEPGSQSSDSGKMDANSA